MWRMALAAAAVIALCSAAFAQQKAPAKPRSAASLECSKQADAQRPARQSAQKIQVKCMRDLRKKAA